MKQLTWGTQVRYGGKTYVVSMRLGDDPQFPELMGITNEQGQIFVEPREIVVVRGRKP